MVNFRTLVVLTAVMTAQAAGQPDWVRNFGKSLSYPEAFYLVGFGTSLEKDRVNARQEAVAGSLADLSRRIKIEVNSKTSSVIQETNQGLSQSASSVTQTSTKLKLEGVETEEYYDDDHGRFYALAHILRERMSELYHEKATRLRSTLGSVMEHAQGLESQGKHSEAIEAYASCYPLIGELEEANAILLVSESAGPPEDGADSSMSAERIGVAIKNIIHRPLRTVDDAAWFMSYTLGHQVSPKQYAVSVNPFSYQDTKMSSSFGRYLKSVLEQKLTEVAKWTVAQDARGAKWVALGSYWMLGDNLKLLLQVRDLQTGEIVAGAESDMPLKAAESQGLSLTPQNFIQAMKDQKVFTENEVVSGGLQVEVWTDRGRDGVVYAKGDTMSVSIRANRECYVRLIYHMADARRNVLLKSFHIPMDKANLVVPVPQSFICSPPFGAEVLQVFARTEDFEPVETESIDGMDIIKEDLATFVGQTRGMKAVKNQQVQQSEARIVVTTLEK